MHKLNCKTFALNFIGKNYLLHVIVCKLMAECIFLTSIGKPVIYSNLQRQNVNFENITGNGTYIKRSYDQGLLQN